MVQSKTNINVFSLLELTDQEIINMMKSLMSEGTDINEIFGDDVHQYTMMHACSFLLKEKALAWMLEHGAEVDMKCSETTALGMLVNNHFCDKPREKSYWTRFGTCLNLLSKHNADFNISNHEGKKPFFVLLENEKENIPKEVINVFFDKTTLKEKKGNNIVDALLLNEVNFTSENINYMVEKRGFDLNSQNSPQESFAFSLAKLPEKIFKKVKKAVDEVYQNYAFKMNVSSTAKSKKAGGIIPIELAISKKNMSFFKFVVEKTPEIMKHRFGDLNLAQYCAMVGFKDGLKYMITEHSFDWDGNEQLVDVCSRANDKLMVKQERMKHMYNTMSAQLSEKPKQTVKRMKI
jgi:hypothetical protein